MLHKYFNQSESCCKLLESIRVMLYKYFNQSGSCCTSTPISRSHALQVLQSVDVMLYKYSNQSESCCTSTQNVLKYAPTHVIYLSFFSTPMNIPRQLCRSSGTVLSFPTPMLMFISKLNCKLAVYCQGHIPASR